MAKNSRPRQRHRRTREAGPLTDRHNNQENEDAQRNDDTRSEQGENLRNDWSAGEGVFPLEASLFRQVPCTLTTGRPLPQPSSNEHPRYLLGLRRRTNARFTKARRTLFPEKRKRLAFLLSIEKPAPVQKTEEERNWIVHQFLDRSHL